jgi:SecD/SecF fusion protein
LIISLPEGRKEININLKHTFMKTNIIIVAIIIAAFSAGECTAKKNFDFKITVLPQTSNSLTILNDVNKAAEVITRRLEYFFSIPQKNIKADISENKISFTVSNIDTSKIGQIKKVITGYAKLEFWETYENSEITGYLKKANNTLKEMQPSAARPDAAKKAEAATPEELKSQNPLFGILKPMVNAQGGPLPSCMIGLAGEKDTSEVNRYLKMDQIKTLFPDDLKFYWSANPYKNEPSKSLYELHAIKVTTSNKKAPLDGSAIISAKTITGSASSGVKIDLMMDSDGAGTFARITRENINRCIAVVLDGYVRSYPRVQSEISGGNCEITGDFTFEEASGLVSIFNSGDLPFGLKIVETQIIKRE